MDTLVSLLACHQVIHAKTLEQRLGSLFFFHEAMIHNPHISAVYAGYDNGDFFLMRHLRRTEVQISAKAPEGAAYLVQSVERNTIGQSQGRFLFYNADLKLIRSDQRHDYTFDPRTRPWFRQASDTQIGETAHTAPYLFFTTREIGQTFARRAMNGRTIVAADLTLQDLSETLARQKVTPSTELALFDLQGHPLGYKDPSRLIGPNDLEGKPTLNHISQLGVPIINRAFFELTGKGRADKNLTLNESNREWYVRIQPLRTQSSSGREEEARTFLAIAAPTDEVFASALHIRNEMLLATFVSLLLALPITWWLASRVTKQLKDLTRQADDIKNFRFHTPDAATSTISEIEHLSSTIAQMKGTICKFLDIAAALSAERRLDQLLDHILTESISAGAAAGGAIYLLDHDGNTLFPSALRSNEGTQSIEHQAPIDIQTTCAAEILLTKAILTLQNQTGFMDISAIQNTCFAGQYSEGQTAILSVIPLFSRDYKALGVLSLFYPDYLPAPTPERIAFVEALSGTAAISIDKQLFERLATIDDLTGVYNRRYAERRFEEEFLRTGRTGRSLGCVMIDIDHFKRINDQFGHLTGDEVLKKVAALIAESLRSYDILCRFGGEEFMAVLPEIELSEAIRIGERIRLMIKDRTAADIQMTVSIGITVNKEGDSYPNDIIQRADNALYQAKNRGRNRVEVQ
jgi:diguanylate cyclase (GGDEF)-like protein